MWKIYKIIVLVFLIQFAFAVSIKSQSEVSEPASLFQNENQCTPELIKKANDFYENRKLRGSEVQFASEKYIKKILEICPKDKLKIDWHKRLEVLGEERAETHLTIANFYLNKSHEGKSGLRGSQVRFLIIVNDYPNYSKIDEALFGLAETYFLENDYDKSKKYFQTVIDQFPESEFADKSISKLALIKEKMSVVYVIGKVTTPSELELKQGLSITEAIEKAGGILPKSKVKYIIICRLKSEDNSERRTLKYRWKDLTKKGSEKLLLKSGDIIFVGKSETSHCVSHTPNYEVFYRLIL